MAGERCGDSNLSALGPSGARRAPASRHRGRSGTSKSFATRSRQISEGRQRQGDAIISAVAAGQNTGSLPPVMMKVVTAERPSLDGTDAMMLLP
jgi:hypothetical protein